MVFYRKYRPQTIGELDNAALRERLYALFANPDHVPHAFLFTGPKGTGKTSTARIIAKIVNCEANGYSEWSMGNGKTEEKKQAVVHQPLTIDQIDPCNHCESCISITNGTNIDVLEIDGASNRGIDEIRDLREKVRLAPAVARKKVYIIDEVHMLTTEAFNALLKTIEEPPAHVLFIFCTTEPHKVPETILSRCLHIAITKGTTSEVVTSLTHVVEAEKLSIDKGVLEEIAHLVDGGFRDAKKILDELVSQAQGQKITSELLRKMYRTGEGAPFIRQLLQLICNADTPAALSLIEQAAAENMDMPYVIDMLMELLHEQLLLQFGVGEGEKMEMTADQIAFLTDALGLARSQMKYAAIAQLPLELAIVSICRGEDSEEVTEPETPASSTPTRSHRPTLGGMMKKQQEVILRQRISPIKPDPAAKKAVIAKSPQIHVNQEVTFLDNLIQKVKAVNNSLSGVLRGVRITEITDTQIIFATNFSFHKERLEEPANYAIIEKAIREITGKGMKVVVQLHK